MVDKNLAGSSVNFTNRFAFLFPSDAILFILLSFMDIIAISAQAKIAFNAINTTCNKIINKIEFPKIFSSQNSSVKRKKTKPILTLASKDYAQTCYQYYTLMEAYYPEYWRLRPFLSMFSFQIVIFYIYVSYLLFFSLTSEPIISLLKGIIYIKFLIFLLKKVRTPRFAPHYHYSATVKDVMCGFTPSYQYKKPSISTTSPICKFLTAAYTSVVLSQR